MNLEQSVASLLEQFGDDAPNALISSEQKLERFGFVAFTGFGIAIGIAILSIIYMIATRMIISGTQPLVGLLLMGFIVFAGLTLGYVFWAESLKEQKQRLSKMRVSQNKSNLSSVKTERLLADPVQQATQSVVEDTTELLRVPRSVKNRD